MSRFDLSKMGQKIEENKVELGKSYLNEASLSMRDTRKKTEYISLDEIVPNPDNKLSMPNVKWLKQDIALEGLLQPLVVAQMDDGKYMLYAGHQRFEAIRQLHQEGKFENTVEVKKVDLDNLNLPDTVSENVRRKLLLRSANIQRGNGYSTDADRYVVISDWKEIYTELRRCGVEVIEFGLEGDDEIRESEQIKGRKTRELVAEKVGLSPAQVGKFERVDNQGVHELKEALKEDKINVATAAEVASMNPQDQKKILEKIRATREITPDNKINGEDIEKAKEVLDDSKKPEKKTIKRKASGLNIISKKKINADLKEAFKSLKEAGEEIEVDQETYSAYMKHIESLNRIIEQAAKR